MAVTEEGATATAAAAGGGIGVAGAVRHLFHLRDLLHRWQYWPMSGKPEPADASSGSTSSSSATPGSPTTPPSRALSSCPSCDLAQEGLIPPDVPKGCLAVYVGEEHRRFVIPAAYLAEPAFGAMLEKAAEEFGFEFTGGIQLPCEVEAFKYILQGMEVRHPSHRLSHCVDASSSADDSAAEGELTSGPVADSGDADSSLVMEHEHAGGHLPAPADPTATPSES